MNLEEVQQKIGESPGMVVYFMQQNCGPCEAIRPKVKNLVETSFPLLELLFLDLEEWKELASSYSVFSAPTIIVFFDGREYLRNSKNLSISVFQEEISRLYEMAFSGDAL